jgi:hypothetical protein
VDLPDSGELPGAAINGAQRRRGDATAGRYRQGRWSRGGGRSGAKLSCVAEWQRGGRRRRPGVTSARGRRTDDEAADPWGRLVRGSERESGWLTGGDALSARGRARCGAAAARAEAGRSWAECGEARARGKGGLRVLGRDSVQQGKERVFPFSFYFSNSISLFAPFSFEQNIL